MLLKCVVVYKYFPATEYPWSLVKEVMLFHEVCGDVNNIWAQ